MVLQRTEAEEDVAVEDVGAHRLDRRDDRVDAQVELVAVHKQRVMDVPSFDYQKKQSFAAITMVFIPHLPTHLLVFCASLTIFKGNFDVVEIFEELR